eukprot:CAMPEP_0203891074 /NCGR_PEP_ID=MMETSP0359-20131031/34416_1 /ASSEMBLY_ACC=CAM_ASM_000338 /TAXON_ID=268821 /ORGANISM="Scrippsiella Hangoei, Strain SHTV-5" /LENGTH=102 /DNA_ID=CAMNT_0050812799 /DNA_START=15 /DNA_END=324 /DNA_ORIENTATION=-
MPAEEALLTMEEQLQQQRPPSPVEQVLDPVRRLRTDAELDKLLRDAMPEHYDDDLPALQPAPWASALSAPRRTRPLDHIKAQDANALPHELSLLHGLFLLMS